MKYSEYLNWILENPANFNFVHSIVDPFGKKIHVYQVYYTDSDTNRKEKTISFKVSELTKKIIDTVTNLEVAKVTDINFNLLNKYCRSNEKS